MGLRAPLRGPNNLYLTEHLDALKCLSETSTVANEVVCLNQQRSHCYSNGQLLQPAAAIEDAIRFEDRLNLYLNVHISQAAHGRLSPATQLGGR